MSSRLGSRALLKASDESGQGADTKMVMVTISAGIFVLCVLAALCYHMFPQLQACWCLDNSDASSQRILSALEQRRKDKLRRQGRAPRAPASRNSESSNDENLFEALTAVPGASPPPGCVACHLLPGVLAGTVVEVHASVGLDELPLPRLAPACSPFGSFSGSKTVQVVVPKGLEESADPTLVYVRIPPASPGGIYFPPAAPAALPYLPRPAREEAVATAVPASQQLLPPSGPQAHSGSSPELRRLGMPTTAQPPRSSTAHSSSKKCNTTYPGRVQQVLSPGEPGTLSIAWDPPSNRPITIKELVNNFHVQYEATMTSPRQGTPLKTWPSPEPSAILPAGYLDALHTTRCLTL